MVKENHALSMHAHRQRDFPQFCCVCLVWIHPVATELYHHGVVLFGNREEEVLVYILQLCRTT